MTAAKIMGVIARLPGCDGQAADAISAHTQVKLECPDVWIPPPKHKWTKSWKIEDPANPIERNLSVHP